jgi:formate hydrogenlyase subunit 3/multisubunit Na+/H+ antiporter MnhD subunit
VLSVTVAVPLAGLIVVALLLTAAPGRHRAVTAVAVATAVATATTALVAAVAVARSGPVTEILGGWEAPLGIPLVADGLSAVMLAMTAVVGVAVTGYALVEGRTGSFWALWPGAWAALNALYVSGDAFNVYVAFEVLAVSAVGLVALAGGPALRAALRYLFVTVLGSLLYLLAVALLYADRGTLDLAGLAAEPGDPTVTAFALALATAGMALKTALLPVHGWLPPAHGGAPAPVSPVLSALVIKGSFVVLARLWFSVLPEAATVPAATLLGLLGAVAALWGAGMALRQERLKLVVAYSTIAQVGYFFLVFPLAVEGTEGAVAGWTGVLTLVVAHGLAKAAMFLAAGALAAGHGTDRLGALAGAVGRQPLAVVAFGLAGVSLVGLPPSLGFTGKFLVVQAAVETGLWWWAVPVVAGGLVSAAYVGHVLAVTLEGAGSDQPDPADGSGTTRAPDMPGAPVTAVPPAVEAGTGTLRLLGVPALVLAALAIALGLAGTLVTIPLADAFPGAGG